jgi:phosphoglycolate phosphatase-like HAD superfamily hydrolase
MKTKYVFDLDGTLVNSRAAVTEAYRRAGVVMPEDAWGKPWQEWLVDPVTRALRHDVHNEKNRIYLSVLEELGQHTDLGLRVRMGFGAPATVITGASPQAVQSMRQCGLLSDTVKVEAYHLTAIGKVDWLATHGWGTYVDDDPRVRQLVKSFTTWCVYAPEELVR